MEPHHNQPNTRSAATRLEISIVFRSRRNKTKISRVQIPPDRELITSSAKSQTRTDNMTQVFKFRRFSPCCFFSANKGFLADERSQAELNGKVFFSQKMFSLQFRQTATLAGISYRRARFFPPSLEQKNLLQDLTEKINFALKQS